MAAEETAGTRTKERISHNISKIIEIIMMKEDPKFKTGKTNQIYLS